jgi:hypothetical protein
MLQTPAHVHSCRERERESVCVCPCVCARARACVRVCVCVYVFTCVHTCLFVCVGGGDPVIKTIYSNKKIKLCKKLKSVLPTVEEEIYC